MCIVRFPSYNEPLAHYVRYQRDIRYITLVSNIRAGTSWKLIHFATVQKRYIQGYKSDCLPLGLGGDWRNWEERVINAMDAHSYACWIRVGRTCGSVADQKSPSPSSSSLKSTNRSAFHTIVSKWVFSVIVPQLITNICDIAPQSKKI